MLSAVVPGLTRLPRVVIDGITFAMGSTAFINAQPVITVAVHGFRVSKTRVTIGAYEEYLSAIKGNRWVLAVRDRRTGGFEVALRGGTRAQIQAAYFATFSTKMSPGARIEDGGFAVFEVTDPDIPPGLGESKEQPMIGIDWWEMLALAAAHGGRLPTEAEYERIMRGSDGKDDYGTASGQLKTSHKGKLAQFEADRTSPVMTHPANSLGVRDASGNVLVWTGSWYAPSYENYGGNYVGEVMESPQGPPCGEHRVVRGGSYDSKGPELHAAFRSAVGPGERRDNIGGVVVWQNRGRSSAKLPRVIGRV